MTRLGMALLASLLVCGTVTADEPEESTTPMVLGGIPLCGDPEVAREFLEPKDPKDRDQFTDQWYHRTTDGPNGTIRIKITDPHIPLQLNDRDPSTLYIYLLDDRIHAVEARWMAKGTVGKFKKLTSELELKVRSALGDPDDVVESTTGKQLFGPDQSEVEYVWSKEHRIIRVFTRKSAMKWFVAVDATCTETLKESMGEANVF